MRIYKQYCQNKYASDINSIDPECKDALHGTRKTILLEWKPTWFQNTQAISQIPTYYKEHGQQHLSVKIKHIAARVENSISFLF